MKLYLIRHGQSEANVKEIFSGWTDVALTDTGKEQAKNVALKLKDQKIDFIASSPLQRAYHTAEAINKYHHLEIVKYEDLKEMGFGDWEGKNYKRIIEDGDRRSMLITNPEESFAFAPKGGESIIDAYSRVTKTFEQIKDQVGEDKNLLIAAHGGVIQILLSHIFHGDYTGFWNYRVENCSLISIEYVEGLPVLNKLNG